jgi:hypothetical protein
MYLEIKNKTKCPAFRISCAKLGGKDCSLCADVDWIHLTED